MPRITVHATLEHPLQKWGGIGSAVGLMTEAARVCGEAAFIMSPAPRDTPAYSAPIGDIRVSVGGATTPGDVYGSSNRIQLGKLIADEMGSALFRSLPFDSVDLIVHNEELLPLIDSCVAKGVDHVLYFAHGVSAQEHPDRPDLGRLQLELLSRRVPVCCSSETQATIAEGLWGRPVAVVRLPLSLLTRHVSPLPDAIDVLAAGRFVPQKGLDILVEAISYLGSGVRCVIVGGHGDPEYEARCRVQANDSGADIEWRSWRDSDELQSLFASSRLVVVPSRFEPLGLVAAEAIAVGTPVLGFDVGGLGELLRATGQHVLPAECLSRPDTGSRALADAISRSLSDSAQIDTSTVLRSWSPQQTLADIAGCWNRNGE